MSNALIVNLADRIANLTAQEAKEVRTYLKDKYEIEAPGGDAPPAPVAEVVKVVEPTEFNVVYEGFDPVKKINLIKSIREIVGGLSLGEAKALVEGPVRTLKESVDRKTADELKVKIEAEGGKISIQAA